MAQHMVIVPVITIATFTSYISVEHITVAIYDVQNESVALFQVHNNKISKTKEQKQSIV
jgi:hypothetical protein